MLPGAGRVLGCEATDQERPLREEEVEPQMHFERLRLCWAGRGVGGFQAGLGPRGSKGVPPPLLLGGGREPVEGGGRARGGWSQRGGDGRRVPTTVLALWGAGRGAALRGFGGGAEGRRGPRGLVDPFPAATVGVSGCLWGLHQGGWLEDKVTPSAFAAWKWGVGLGPAQRLATAVPEPVGCESALSSSE